MSAQRLHATTVLLGERGVLIRGSSGSGKSALALALLARPPVIVPARTPALVRLVADDQTWVEAVNGRLLAWPDPRLAGRIEARGHGLLAFRHEPICVVGLIVDRVASQRLPSVHQTESLIEGVRLPCVAIAPDEPDPVARLVLAVTAVRADVEVSA
jgi:serine kinase of HPr protein (carbohydrate metabolism regulator)